MTLADLNLEEFLAELGSDSSTPGGGGAAALTGANAAGLVSMVARLTARHSEFAAKHEMRLQEIIASADRLREDLRHAIDQDALAFGGLMAAFKLPKNTTEEKQARSEAVQVGLKLAAASPLEIARLCAVLVAMALELAQIGNPHTVTDAGTAATLAEAALVGALLQTRVNLKTLKDTAYVEAVRREIATLEKAAASERAKTLEITLAKL